MVNFDLLAAAGAEGQDEGRLTLLDLLHCCKSLRLKVSRLKRQVPGRNARDVLIKVFFNH